MTKNKQSFISRLIILFFLPVLFTGTGCSSPSDGNRWKLGLQTYTFHNYTLMETLQKAEELGLTYVEAFFSQQLGEGFPDSLYLNYNLSAEQKELLKEKFAEHQINWYASGVAFYDNEADWRRFFSFASEMGMKVITAEPSPNDLGLVDKLAQEFNIEVAIHNHPEPSVYANPDVLERFLDGRSNLIGVCADIGHWKRAGFDPLETIKRFEGRLKVVHMKDLTADLEDAPWGSGILPLKEIIQELQRQQFDGLISVEYENFNSSQTDDIAKSIKWFNDVSTGSATIEDNSPVSLLHQLDKEAPLNTLTEKEAKNGWQLLFDGQSFTGWHGYNMDGVPGFWIIEEQALTMTTEGGAESQDIITNKIYKDFALSAEYRLTRGANSGIIYQVKEDSLYRFPYETGPEFQIIDHENWPDPLEDWQINGANYAMYPPRVKPYKPLGEWNSLLLVVKGNQVTQILNGEVVVEYEKYSDDWNMLRNSGKWADFPDYGKYDEGHISLQNHGTKVWYRNLKIKEL